MQPPALSKHVAQSSQHEPHSVSSSSKRRHLRQIDMQGHLFRAAFLRHVPLFVRNLAENVVLCLAAASVESTAKTVMAHMELVWRRKLTSRMHLPYFENMVCVVTCMHLQYHLKLQIMFCQ